MDYEGNPKDDSGGGGNVPADLSMLEAKTQNIVLPDTTDGFTKLAGSLSTSGISVTGSVAVNGDIFCNNESLDPRSVFEDTNSDPVTHRDVLGFNSYGMQFQFTNDTDLLLEAVDIPMIIWSREYDWYGTLVDYGPGKGVLGVRFNFTIVKAKCTIIDNMWYRYTMPKPRVLPKGDYFRLVVNPDGDVGVQYIDRPNLPYRYASNLVESMCGSVATIADDNNFPAPENMQFFGGGFRQLYPCVPCVGYPDTSLVQASDFATSSYPSVNAELSRLKSAAITNKSKIWSFPTNNPAIIGATQTSDIIYNSPTMAWSVGIGSKAQIPPWSTPNSLVPADVSFGTLSPVRSMFNIVNAIVDNTTGYSQVDYKIKCGLYLQLTGPAINYGDFTIAVYVSCKYLSNVSTTQEDRVCYTEMVLPRVYDPGNNRPFVLSYQREFYVPKTMFIGSDEITKALFTPMLILKSSVWSGIITVVASTSDDGALGNYLEVERISDMLSTDGLSATDPGLP